MCCFVVVSFQMISICIKKFSIQKDSKLGYGIVLDNLDTTCDPIYNGLVLLGVEWSNERIRRLSIPRKVIIT